MSGPIVQLIATKAQRAKRAVLIVVMNCAIGLRLYDRAHIIREVNKCGGQIFGARTLFGATICVAERAIVCVVCRNVPHKRACELVGHVVAQNAHDCERL